jgi:glyoxylase-like metal-dependent hydrolase (beta-lactamase superfamily II)
VEVREIAPGLWRWTGYHEEWKQEVGCVYLEAPDAICLIDPLVPAEAREKFLAALDRDVERAALPVHALVTVFWHTRSADELAERYGAEVWAPSRARKAVERRAGRARAFRPGDTLPGGAEAFATARSNEVVLYLPAYRALVAGDVILGSPTRLCPDSWLPPGVGQDELRESLQPVLELDVERILISHGEPVLERGNRALRALLARRAAPKDRPVRPNGSSR